MAGSRLAVEVLFAEKRMKPQNHDLVSLAITRSVPVKAGPTVSLKFSTPVITIILELLITINLHVQTPALLDRQPTLT